MRPVFIAVVVVLALVSPSSVARASPLLEAEVVEGLDAGHPLLAAARARVPEARGERRAAEGAFDVSWKTRAVGAPLGAYGGWAIDTLLEQPTTAWGTRVFTGYRWGSDDVAIYDGKSVTNDAGEVRLGVQVPLWRDGPIDRRRATIARAVLGERLAELGVRQQRLELVRLGRQRYWEWVATGRRLALARGLLDGAEARDLWLVGRVERGDLPELERIDNLRLIAQRRQQVVAATRALERAALELSLYLRDRDGGVRVPTADQLPQVLAEPAGRVALDAAEVALALARRPEALRARGRADQARVEARLADNQAAPALDVTLMGARDLGEGPEVRRELELAAGVMLDIPLQRNAARGRAEVARAQVRGALDEARFADDKVRQELADAASAMVAAVARLAGAREELVLARRVEAGERERLELGDSTLLVVNLREIAALEAAQREVDALLDYHLGRVTWDAARGAEQRLGLP